MSYEARITQDQFDNRYRNLKNRAEAVESRVQTCIDEATGLHLDTVDAAEKVEIIALRDSLVANLRTILGV